jgi:hypothetical protein
MRWTLLTTSFGLLLACLLLGFAPAAFASNYDMRGEWAIELTATKPGSPRLPGTDIIGTQQASGEFSGHVSYFIGLTATISGTISGSEASVTLVANTPEGVITFIATKIAINVAENKFTGAGTFYNAKNEPTETGEFISERIKTYQEVQEREAREQKEREERQARLNVRGEWEFVLTVGPHTSKAKALIATAANASNEFASNSLLFEGVVPGAFSGKLEGTAATVKLTNQAAGEVPAGEFTSATMTVVSSSNPTSMTGTGKFVIPELHIETVGELTATRIHTYAEVQEREATEKAEREAKEAEEALAKQAREAKEAREAREAKEAKERLEQEALKKQTTTTQNGGGGTALLPAEPSSKALTATGAGVLALKLANPNAFAVDGRLTLIAISTGGSKASVASSRTRRVTLATSSFDIAAHASEIVKLKLSRKGLSELRHHGALRVTLTVSTETSGRASVSGTYTLTLHPHRGKG